MSKKVLGLVASPRKVGNSEILLKEAMLAAGEDWDKEIINLYDLNIETCRACYRCLPEGAPCVIQDDFPGLMEKIEAADAIILASPVYFLGSNSVLRKTIERFMSVGAETRRFSGKPCLIITVYGIENWAGIGREQNNLFAHVLSLDLKDSILVHSPYPGEMLRHDTVVESIRQAAANLFDPASGKKPEPNACPSCGNPYLQICLDSTVLCPLCGQTGKVYLSQGKTAIEFTEPLSQRFTVEEIHHHFAVAIQATIHEVKKQREWIKETLNKYRKINW